MGKGMREKGERGDWGWLLGGGAQRGGKYRKGSRFQCEDQKLTLMGGSV